MAEGILSRIGNLFASAILLLGLSSCFATPGTFQAALDIRRDGTFRFAYAGEIHVDALAGLAQLSTLPPGADGFVPEACFKDDFQRERPCTPAELADQRAQQEQWQRGGDGLNAAQRGMIDSFMPDFDPQDPEAIARFAANLERQAGWNSVRYLGDGLFSVDFATAGPLPDAFAFPVMETLPMTSAFVQIVRRDGGEVAIRAPGFYNQAQSEGPAWPKPEELVLGTAAAGGREAPLVNGTFTITTDGVIASSNGGQRAGDGDGIAWTITPDTPSPPVAVIQLTQ